MKLFSETVNKKRFTFNIFTSSVCERDRNGEREYAVIQYDIIHLSRWFLLKQKIYYCPLMLAIIELNVYTLCINAQPFERIEFRPRH